jgi:surface antigen
MPAIHLRAVLAAAAFAAAAGAAQAQNLGFMRDSVMSNITPADATLMQKNYLEALELPDGHMSTWNNPQTGASGTARPLKSFQQKGMACRQLEMSTTARGQTGTGQFVFCKTKGGWKILS